MAKSAAYWSAPTERFRILSFNSSVPEFHPGLIPEVWQFWSILEIFVASLEPPTSCTWTIQSAVLDACTESVGKKNIAIIKTMIILRILSNVSTRNKIDNKVWKHDSNNSDSRIGHGCPDFFHFAFISFCRKQQIRNIQTTTNRHKRESNFH